MQGYSLLRTSPEQPRHQPPRRVFSWHVTPEGRYRLVVTTWARLGHTTTNESTGYTARTVHQLWTILWLSGYIPSDTYWDHAAYRAFVMLGAARQHQPIPSTTTQLTPHPAPSPSVR